MISQAALGSGGVIPVNVCDTSSLLALK